VSPYIKRSARQGVDDRGVAQTAGELNYAITQLIIAYVDEHKLSYQTICDVSGATRGALTEFNRRVAAPYEDDKIFDNGDVYPPRMTQQRPKFPKQWALNVQPAGQVYEKLAHRPEGTSNE